MKPLLFSLSFCLLLICSCNNTPKNSSKAEKLYIKTTTAIGSSIENIKGTDVVSEITTDYFEVSLASQTNGGYLAQKDIVTPESAENFKSVFLTIVNKDGSEIKFMISTEFLNFMSAHGYEMVTQIPNEYGGDYTFKKK